MEITRLAPFPLNLSYSGLTPSTDYVVAIMTDFAGDLVEIPVSSDGSGVISTPLPDFFSRYDEDYNLEVYEQTGTNADGSAILGDIAIIDTLSISRPYVDPTTLGSTEEEVEQARQYEALARAVINSVTGGFTYKRQVSEQVGLGNDFLYIPGRLNKIIKVWENDILVFDNEGAEAVTDRTYFVTPDKGAITQAMPELPSGYNRMESKPVYPQMPASDSFTLYNTNDSPNIIQNVKGSPFFMEGSDYKIIVEIGWPVIPQDIQQATKLLISDMQCNNASFINSYIKDYSSDQYDISFDAGAFKETGNRIVDQILSNYPRTINRIGVI